MYYKVVETSATDIVIAEDIEADSSDHAAGYVCDMFAAAVGDEFTMVAQDGTAQDYEVRLYNASTGVLLS